MGSYAAERPTVSGVVSGCLVVVGVLLWMLVSKGFLIVAGIGAFGPGILRELGWLRDQDEFQRQAARRAGYHAYLVGGLVAVVILSVFDATSTDMENGAEWMRLIVTVLWMSWMFSALLAFWGARKTASRLLTVFGAFWAVFVIASLIGEGSEDVSMSDGILGVSFGVGLIGAFLVPAWTARRWPFWTGVVLLLVSAALIWMFSGNGGLSWATTLLTSTLLIVPLAACGIALVRDVRGASDEAESDE